MFRTVALLDRFVPCSRLDAESGIFFSIRLEDPTLLNILLSMLVMFSYYKHIDFDVKSGLPSIISCVKIFCAAFSLILQLLAGIRSWGSCMLFQ